MLTNTKLSQLRASATCMAGVVLVLLSDPKLGLRFLNAAFESGIWRQSAPAVSLAFLLAGVTVSALGILFLVYPGGVGNVTSGLVRDCLEGLRRLRQTEWKTVLPIAPRIPRGDAVLLTLALGLGLAIRMYFLAAPLRFDEAYTFLTFVEPGGKDLFRYNVPNNHVLHSMLAYVSTTVWGAHPASLRFPSLVAGMLTIPVAFTLTRSLFGSTSGAVAAIGVAVWPFIVLYSSIARGYSLVLLLTLAMCLVGLRVVRSPSPGGCVALSLIAALGMLTIPVMLMPAAGVYLWLSLLHLVERRDPWLTLRGFVAPCALATVVLTVVFYAPTLRASGLESLITNPRIEAQSLDSFSHGLVPHIGAVGRRFGEGVPRAVEAAVALLALLGFLRAARARDRAAVLLLPVVLVGFTMVLVAKQRIPHARTWIIFLPLVILLADGGADYLLGKLRRSWRSASLVLFTLAAFVYSGSLLSRNVIDRFSDSGHVPEAGTVARYLLATAGPDDVIFSGPLVDYYLWYYGGYRNTAELDEVEPDLFVVKEFQSIDEMTSSPVEEIVRFGKTRLYRRLPSESAERSTR